MGMSDLLETLGALVLVAGVFVLAGLGAALVLLAVCLMVGGLAVENLKRR